MKHLYSGFRKLSFGIKAAPVIRQRLGVFLSQSHSSSTACREDNRPCGSSDVYVCDLPWVKISCLLFSRRRRLLAFLAKVFAALIGASTFFRSRVFRLFGIVCHELPSLSVVNPGVKLLN
jgi:hypothetical protein